MIRWARTEDGDLISLDHIESIELIEGRWTAIPVGSWTGVKWTLDCEAHLDVKELQDALNGYGRKR